MLGCWSCPPDHRKYVQVWERQVGGRDQLDIGQHHIILPPNNTTLSTIIANITIWRKKIVTQPRRGTWPCEPLAWPVPRSSLRSCWARWNPRWQAWDLEENSRTDVSQEGSSRRKRAIDSVQQNSIIGLDVDIMVAAAPGDTNHSIPAIVDEAVQTYLTVSQLYWAFFKLNV